MRKTALLILLLTFSAVVSAKTKLVQLDFSAVINGEKAVTGTYFHFNAKDSLMLENFRCYISGIELLDQNKTVFSESNSYHLLDLLTTNNQIIEFSIPEKLRFTHIRFQLGIDSLTNVSGAYGGDLDPSSGMYWSWQSGYINVKLEGKSSVFGKNQAFTYHLGGYSKEQNALQTVTLATNLLQAKIVCDLGNFFNENNFTGNEIMSPGKNAVQFATRLAAAFMISE